MRGRTCIMTKEKIVFDCEDALQMKAVAVMIQKASQYHSTIYIVRSGRRANAKSLLGVMSLGIENGAEIEFYLLDETHDCTFAGKSTYYGDRFSIELPLPNFTSYLMKIKKK